MRSGDVQTVLRRAVDLLRALAMRVNCRPDDDADSAGFLRKLRRGQRATKRIDLGITFIILGA